MGVDEGNSFVATQSIHRYSECSLLKRDWQYSINPGNALMGCALAGNLAPEAATVPPLITGDRSFSWLVVGTIGLPDVVTILATQGSRGL